MRPKQDTSNRPGARRAKRKRKACRQLAQFLQISLGVADVHRIHVLHNALLWPVDLDAHLSAESAGLQQQSGGASLATFFSGVIGELSGSYVADKCSPAARRGTASCALSSASPASLRRSRYFRWRMRRAPPCSRSCCPHALLSAVGRPVLVDPRNARLSQEGGHARRAAQLRREYWRHGNPDCELRDRSTYGLVFPRADVFRRNGRRPDALFNRNRYETKIPV